MALPFCHPVVTRQLPASRSAQGKAYACPLSGCPGQTSAQADVKRVGFISGRWRCPIPRGRPHRPTVAPDPGLGGSPSPRGPCRGTEVSGAGRGLARELPTPSPPGGHWRPQAGGQQRRGHAASQAPAPERPGCSSRPGVKGRSPSRLQGVSRAGLRTLAHGGVQTPHGARAEVALLAAVTLVVSGALASLHAGPRGPHGPQLGPAASLRHQDWGETAVLGPPPPHPRGPGASHMGRVYGAVGGSLREGCGGLAQGRPLKSCCLRPRAGALPRKGTTQDRPQGLRARHLVPWGQFWSVTQACVQDSSQEEELSSGHAAACPAHRRQVGRWAGVRPPQPPLGLLGDKVGTDRKPRESSPQPLDTPLGREKGSGSRATGLTSVSAARSTEPGLSHLRGVRLPTPS